MSILTPRSFGTFKLTGTFGDKRNNILYANKDIL